MRALAEKGVRVQPYKAGPDYIDPGYHQQATGFSSRNLDSWLLPRDTLLELFSHSAAGAGIAVIEGVMGLYDGKLDGEKPEASPAGSTAQLSKILAAPVILVLDAGRIAGSAAAIALGYRELDRGVKLAGVILNRVGSKSHYRQLKRAIEEHAGLPVLGCLFRDEALYIPERHLGLVPAQEYRPDAFWEQLVSRIEAGIDLERMLKIADQAGPLPEFKPHIFVSPAGPARVRIGVARDKAFSFYYQDNLDILAHLGGEPVYFSPLEDEGLPVGVAGLYLGGGFPEVFARQLGRNDKLKLAIRRAAAGGLPIYAECGGLLYLTRGIINGEGEFYPMVGLIEGHARLQNRRQALGYVRLRVMKDNILSHKGDSLRGHEFHWSTLEGMVEDDGYAYELPGYHSPRPRREGVARGNLLASYIHLHFGSCLELAENFIAQCVKYIRQAPRNWE
jgi:cobyrinic acid a,c-diamide synthase